jgi:hypothetical protein
MTDDLTDDEPQRLAWISRRLDSLAGARLVRPLSPADQAEWERLIEEQKSLLARRRSTVDMDLSADDGCDDSR